MADKFYSDFDEHIGCWQFDTSDEHVLLCIHEGAHVVYKRDCGFEPEVYGPHVSYINGERRNVLGSTQGLPHEISMFADPVLVGKSHLGPVLIEQRIVGDEWDETLWEQASGDLLNYKNWRVERGQKEIFNEIFAAVELDFSDSQFRTRLIQTAQEYEQKIFNSRFRLVAS